MKVVDDFLAPEELRALCNAMLAPGFSWRRVPILSSGASEHMAPTENGQWVHGFFHCRGSTPYVSPTFRTVRPVIERLGPVRLLKVKANLTVRRGRHLEYGLHVDTRHPRAMTGILYLNDNNGYTRFDDGSRVDSIANRFVAFDARRRHTGASCTDVPYRLVLNVNWLAVGTAVLPMHAS